MTTAVTENAPGRCANTAEGQDLATNHQEGAKVMPSISECRHCTVPTTEGDVCTFCADYTPPAPRNERLANLGDMLGKFAGIVERAAERMPADTPLWTTIDTVTAAAHLRAAARLLNQAATR